MNHEPVRDPEGIETSHLFELAEVRQARVLEIGSGDGRLTWRYAAAAAGVAAIDVDRERLAQARHSRPAELAPVVSILQAASEALPFRDQSFDTVLLAWSL